jgi:RNA polymerase sigma-70 factor, ECF subfamily
LPQLLFGAWRVEHPKSLGDPGCIGDISVTAGLIERRRAVLSVRQQETVHLGDVHPLEKMWIRRLVGRAVRRDAVHPPVDATHLVDRPLRVVSRAERGDGEEGAGALQPSPRVAAVVGVLGDAGHGERVQRLEKQRPQTPDEHRGIGVDAPDRTVLAEPARARSVVNPGPVAGSVRTGNQAEQRAPETGSHSDRAAHQAHVNDGTRGSDAAGLCLDDRVAVGDDSSAGPNQATEDFVAVRGRLFGIAYRMLGSRTEAEDIVQETWLRWQDYDHSEVRDPAAFLATITTRLCLNALQSARVRRETYIGPWLPEPVDTGADPLLGAERGEALELATLMLLERLPPTERAAYVLREAFDYPYAQVAEVLQVKEDHARQLVGRARKHIAEERRAPVDSEEQKRLLEALVAAAQKGDLQRLERLLADDVVSYTDGNGMRGASRRPVRGRTVVAKFLAAFAPRFWPGTSLTWMDANGQPAVVISRDDAVVALLALSASAAGIDRLMWVMSPEKLRLISPPSST